jgi:hypothetical protein
MTDARDGPEKDRDYGTRFKPGKSGNPRGRPKKEPRYPTETQVFYDIVGTMEQEVTVTRDGKKRKMPAVVAAMDVLLAKGLKGDFRSLEILLSLWKGAIRNFSKENSKLEELIQETDLYFSVKRDFEKNKEPVDKDWSAFRNDPAYQLAKHRSEMTMPKRRG